ncbi:LysR family transcriptional regulator [Sphingosinicella soli]|uniref:DNA-binding transcriptional LysR family regulator n=1 Tax=Sphingosinicella soli TaxID=333708 RepID=A0A7W7AZ61_9SPHN|nr:LysR family transcriptional regulator [Sphingosinicella soli]MBB4631032.1 DNA-binding transcriptional LysR family regulator [Sphingosinicella soli]
MDADYALFAKIIESGSLSAAARAVGLSPAMVSKRLARLEARLGAGLVNRTTRRLALTETGARFHADVLAILKAVAEAEARASGETTGSPAGLLRVSAPTSFGRLHIAPHLKRFLDDYPRITLDLDLSDGFADLMAARIDVAVRITPTGGGGVSARRLATNRRILCAAPAYIAQRGTPEDTAALARHQLLAATGQFPWRLTGGDGRTVSIDGTSRVRTNSSEVVRELCIAGVGIALRSLWDVSADLAAGRLERILPDCEGSADVGIYAVSPRRSEIAPAVRAFTDFLEGLYGPVPPWEG